MISSIEGVQELLPGTLHHVFVEVPFWNSRPSMGYFAEASWPLLVLQNSNPSGPKRLRLQFFFGEFV